MAVGVAVSFVGTETVHGEPGDNASLARDQTGRRRRFTDRQCLLNKKKALNKNDVMRQKQEQSKEGVAVIGAGCQYPGGCNSLEDYWAFLRQGKFAIGGIPPGRWPRGPGEPPPCKGGFLPEPFPYAFDAAFFGIPPKEAEALDPQQRLLLETAWRACEDAGLVPDPEAGRQIGVFLGISTADYQSAQLWRPDLAGINLFTATGVSFAAAAGRLSYVFGFEGPCLAIDTACSSSLVAVHQACQALRSGECEAALVAGVNALLAPNLNACLSSMGLLSADGRCKAFDASGDGYVRAEGCGALVLKMADRARRDGDQILAVLRGSAVNQDGRSNGLTAPSRRAQERVIRQALANADLSPGDIDYVEAHGTGTPLGDAIELGALIETYAANRDPEAPLLVGSCKTNIGHLEAGAGIAGLLKAILSLRHAVIPPHLHLDRPTSEVKWSDVALRVPTETTSWPETGRPRRAGVSSFGFSGTNAHVIVEEAPRETMTEPASASPVLLPLSARTPAALETLTANIADWLEAAPRNLADVGLTLGIGRTAFPHRRAVVGKTAAELAARLRDEIPQNPGAAEGEPMSRKLEELARLWMEGGEVDWARLYEPYGARITSAPGHPFQRHRYWPDSLGDDSEPAPPAASSAVSRAISTPTGIGDRDRSDFLRAFIDERARRVLSDQPLAPLDPDLALLDQGFTSLTAVELRNILETDLQTTVPATFFFNYPSINRMVDFFLEEPPHPVASATQELPPAKPTDSEYTFLDDLSDEELETLIDREVDVP